MGIVLNNQGKLEEAIKAYTKVLSVKPDYAKAYNNMGISLKDQGKLDKAIEAYNKALSINPDYAEALHHMGIALQDQGKLNKAIEAYNKALSINPDYDALIENFFLLETQLLNTENINKKLRNITNKQIIRLKKRPKFQILKAVSLFIDADLNTTQEHIKNFKRCDENLFSSMKPKDKIFCIGYANFLNRLTEKPLPKTISDSDNLIYHLGESHCLSYAHQFININGTDFKILPKITFGGKAFHFSRKVNNQYKAITKANFYGIPKGSKVFISFGEIDCRPNEGFISAASKINRPMDDLITDTVRGYINWFAEQNQNKNHSLFFFNVPAPIYNEKFTAEVNEEITSIIKSFNNSINKIALYHNFNIIDVYKFTVRCDGFSNGSFHLDSYHLTRDAIFEIEKQIST